jgi:hypothetical protein
MVTTLLAAVLVVVVFLSFADPGGGIGSRHRH